MSEPGASGGSEPDAHGIERTLCRESRRQDEDSLPFDQGPAEHGEQTVSGNQSRDGASCHRPDYTGTGAVRRRRLAWRPFRRILARITASADSRSTALAPQEERCHDCAWSASAVRLSCRRSQAWKRAMMGPTVAAMQIRCESLLIRRPT